MLTTAPAADRALYLTFDDGPDPDYTPRLLDLLAANDAHASFFLLGEEAERHPRIVERMVAGGHLLGNHSWNHPNFTRIDWREQLGQIEATDRMLERFDGRREHLFRPPSGHFTPSMVARFALRGRGVGTEQLYAALSAYLLAGLFFGVLYDLMSSAWPGSFALGGAAVELTPPTAIYFSFVTIATLGYGDIVPASDAARGVAIVEAVAGQLYVAVMIARLVALHVDRTRHV